ncbi:MAG TPA: LysM peptidoglycan-binding domain-containing protein [Candidatus Acidoferrales bacterium]|nr:LysM peptidoglycan-binding domain-containing protein [Candidatus Acidoferrales bacterium]
MSSRLYLWVIAGAALLGMAGCEPTNNPKAKKADPPPQAVAPTISQPVAQDPAPKIQEQPVPHIDPVENLLSQVEKDFQAGQANYQAGHLEQAKANFDQAFNRLLSYPGGVKSDDRLGDEFDKVVEAVNNLEMQALKQGDGFTQQASEPAPIDVANDVTFPVDPNIKAKAEAELKGTRSDLPLMLNDYVASYINYFSSRGKGFLENGLIRAGRYEPMIRRILKEEGVPQDLIYLAQAESGFHPMALSRAGARGMWQFMAGRGSGYGLERNWWVDERQDPEKSTRAAARHLKDLYHQFGDWYLAMAAYNSGPGNVQQAVQRTGYADFWELYKRNVLPAETKNYVPIILAVTIMAKNPSQYGLENLQPEPPLQYETVKVDYPVDLRLVAECADASLNTIQDLNPALLRMTTPKEGVYDLKLPSGTSDRFQQAIAGIPRDKRVWWRYHKVGNGETLSEIAKQYHTTSSSIAEVNNIDAGDDLHVGSRLVIPIAPGRESQRMAFSKRPTIYKVRKGDTVLTVADDFSVPVEKLRSWNRLKGNSLKPGRTLRIYRPVAGSPASETHVASSKSGKSNKNNSLQASKHTVHHKVRKGETLSSIAEDYNTTVAALRRDNGRTASNLHAGSVLVIHTSAE